MKKVTIKVDENTLKALKELYRGPEGVVKKTLEKETKKAVKAPVEIKVVIERRK